ncbi:MAG: hypothetical protein PHH16_04410 [Candidatus Gracilibacteria bacterium]|nr:hypothetical protein [Candidatus Gracilibacteria bacterium]
MKRFLSWFGKKAIGGIITGLFLITTILGIVYATVSWPSSTPIGEVSGGKFMQYFTSIKVACPAGQYLNGYDINYNKVCATAPVGPQGPAGVNGTTGPAGPAGIPGVQGPAIKGWGSNVTTSTYDLTFNGAQWNGGTPIDCGTSGATECRYIDTQIHDFCIITTVGGGAPHISLTSLGGGIYRLSNHRYVSNSTAIGATCYNWH